jgi:Zn-dependent peptidase ImmA (M78 family)
MPRLVSKITEKIKKYGGTSSREIGTLLTLCEKPYYAEMRELAREVRKRYGLRTPRVELSDLEKICNAEGAKLDIWPGEFRRLRGAYFNDTYGAHVMVMKGLGKDATVFTIAHELKHHLFDASLKPYSSWHLSVPDPIEVGAEIFAAELIYPETNFRSDLKRMGLRRGAWAIEAIVRLKRETGTTLPYKLIAERAVRMGFASQKSFDSKDWRRLERKDW